MARICTGEVWVRRMVPSVRRARRVAAGLGHVQRVPQVARRVVGRDVERLEVPPLGLDLRPLEHLEAEGVEDLAEVTLGGHGSGAGDRSAPDRPARSCRGARPPAGRPGRRRVTSARRAVDGSLDLVRAPRSPACPARAAPPPAPRPAAACSAVSAPDRPSSSWRSASTAAASAAAASRVRASARSCSRRVARSVIVHRSCNHRRKTNDPAPITEQGRGCRRQTTPASW